MKREEIELQYKWAIDEMFDDNSFNLAIENLRSKNEKLISFKGNLSDDHSILEAMNTADEIEMIMSELYCYTKMKQDENTTLPASQTNMQKIMQVLTECEMSGAFLTPELISKGEATLLRLKADERFKDYDHFFDNLLREIKHYLDAQGEEILAAFTEVFASAGEIYDMLHDADMKFDDVLMPDGSYKTLTNGNYVNFLRDESIDVRRRAFESMYKSFREHKFTITSTYSSSIKADIANSRLRKYASVKEQVLDSDNVSLEVYDNLVKVVKENVNLLQRFVNLKQKSLNFTEMQYYDLYLPFVREYDREIPFDEGFEIVLNGLAPLGAEYQSILQKAKDERWMDVYENEGKRSGAYSFGSYRSKPFLLLNYHNRLNDVSTLAHELGHSVHSYYARTNQPHSKAEYSLFVAEVASTVNEAILIQYMLKNAKNDMEKKSLIGQFLEQFKGTLFRQTMFAEFEDIVHSEIESGNPLNADDMAEIHANLNNEYFGNSVVHNENIAYEWSRIPHFYNSFYVYKYATSYCAAIALSKKILSGGEAGAKALNDYISFLKLGGSVYPIDALKVAGVDMSSKEPIKLAMEYFTELMNEFDSLL